MDTTEFLKKNKSSQTEEDVRDAKVVLDILSLCKTHHNAMIVLCLAVEVISCTAGQSDLKSPMVTTDRVKSALLTLSATV